MAVSSVQKTKLATPTQAELQQGRVYNFGAGPAMLPIEVMQLAQSEFTDWQGKGISVMEMSHRCDDFIAIAEQAENDLRDLLSVPDHYKILFLQGGATSQFAMVPLNLLGDKYTADYLHTGLWSGKAVKEAQKYCKVNISLSTEAENFNSIPPIMQWNLNSNAAYLYYTDNETTQGVEFHLTPDSGDVPLVSDMTSNILAKPINVARYGIIFAGAQKNLGPAGLVVVIIREDLIGRAKLTVPSMYDYAVHSKERSLYNTPPTYIWYIVGLVLRWVKENGGVPEMERRALQKSGNLYQFIDNSGFYHNAVEKNCRSRMNVPFTLANENLNSTFISEAKCNGLLALAGHRSVGGMRASIYNAMPAEGVNKLIDFMSGFEQRYG
jgi:phosphoserine aminotransferase